MQTIFPFEGESLNLLKLPFGIRHRILRALLNISIQTVAEGAGVDEYTVTRWEQHGVNPYESTRDRLAAYYASLGVPSEFIDA